VLDASARNVGWKDQRYQVTLERPGTLGSGSCTTRHRCSSAATRERPTIPCPVTMGRGARHSRCRTRSSGDSGEPEHELQASDRGGRGFPLLRLAHPSRHPGVRRPVLARRGGRDGRVREHRQEGRHPVRAYLQIPIEVPLPIDSRANDVRTSIEWANAKGLLRAGWDGSWYDNQAAEFRLGQPAARGEHQLRLLAGPDGRVAEQ